MVGWWLEYYSFLLESAKISRANVPLVSGRVLRYSCFFFGCKMCTSAVCFWLKTQPCWFRKGTKKSTKPTFAESDELSCRSSTLTAKTRNSTNRNQKEAPNLGILNQCFRWKFHMFSKHQGWFNINVKLLMWKLWLFRFTVLSHLFLMSEPVFKNNRPYHSKSHQTTLRRFKRFTLARSVSESRATKQTSVTFHWIQVG